mmetsp:Transcript_21617/g.49902  ORF Transcript_21617/g.49902 Transcript_21617/m.49902 type:complete len:165 (+) Transcript_21617:385-879(+)
MAISFNKMTPRYVFGLGYDLFFHAMKLIDCLGTKKFLEAFFRQEEEKERKMMEDMIAHLLVLEKEEKSRRLTEGGGEDDETYSGPLKFEGDFSTPEAEDEENLMDNPPFVIDEEDVDPTEGLAQMRAEEEDPELGEAEIRKEEQKTGRKQRSLLRQGGYRHGTF